MSKKVFLTVLFILLVSLPTVAQIHTMPKLVDKGDSIDLVKYRVTYTLDFISDPSDRDFVTQDVVRLDIGTKKTKQYSYLLYQTDSLSKEAIEKGKFPHILNKIVPPIVIYKSYPKEGELTMDYRLPSKAPVMTYSETTPQLKWQIKNDKKEIIGFNCQKAEVNYGGRQWTAWFTQEIPIPDGPYKFGGLPGLIMEMVDSQGDYHYTCVGISNVLGNVPMLRWDWKQKQLTKMIWIKLYVNCMQIQNKHLKLSVPLLASQEIQCLIFLIIQ